MQSHASMPIYPKFGCQLPSEFRVDLLQRHYLLVYGGPRQRAQADLVDPEFSGAQSEGSHHGERHGVLLHGLRGKGNG